MALCVSVSIGVFLCEAGARVILRPGDYLSATTIRDEILGIRIAPNSVGADEWGFRNERVPSTANVVAIGDSHTYGNTAAMADSWPSVVARSTGETVYNLGVGGYGPNQYYHLLTTKALKLHPKWVVCGVYMGDDFENAFSITYGLEYWAPFRKGRWNSVDANIWEGREAPGFAAGTRNWLSEHSMVYRMVVHGPLVGRIKEAVRYRRMSVEEDPQTIVLRIPDASVREAFRPIGLAARLDQSSERVREGMRITFELLRDMNEACVREGCRFVVAIIPTKETVFSRYFEGTARIHLREALDRLIANERLARNELVKFLESGRIAYVDVLPALEKATGGELYARTTRDMHPGKNGYRVIGEAVAAYLKDSGLGS